MELPEFVHNAVFSSLRVHRKIPTYFEWVVDEDKLNCNCILISADFKRFHHFRQYMRATPEREEIYARFLDASQFLLGTKLYRDMIDDHLNEPFSPAILRSLRGQLVFWSQLACHHKYIHDEDVINHFFGIEPLSDKKIFSLL